MKRRLSDEEARLWGKVTSGVTPIQPQRHHLIDDPLEPAVSGRRSQRFSAALRHEEKPHALRAPSALGAGDPKADRMVARGRREIDATLDLHGMTQVQALAALYHFLADSRVRGRRCVLVITGKGGSTGAADAERDGAGRGILRRRFLDWIDAPALRPMISRVAQANRRHGGGGAFYVFLKRRR